MKVSILICSFKGSKYLQQTFDSLKETFPREINHEVLVDIEEEKTGLANTANRYMELFKKSSGNICIKIDDDVKFYTSWFENCIKILETDSTIGYCSPISHFLMKSMNVRHACDKRIPIYAPVNKLFEYDSILSGMCWLMKRELWEEIPYNLIKTWHLDGSYAALVKSKGYKTAAYYGALISHLGQERYKGLPSDIPGKPPSIAFKNKHPEIDFTIK
jgi:GT2 family glycosyltransferase